jgi:tetratricopeptide (TPR) repeat protein
VRSRRAAELAWHFAEAADTDRALAYSLSAGDQAEALWSHHDARSHYETALALSRGLETPQREAIVREKFGGLFTATIRYSEALSMLEAAAALWRKAGDQEAEARVVAQMGRVHVADGSLEDGIRLLSDTLDALSGLTPGSTAALHSVLARLLLAVERFDDAAAEVDSALAASGPSVPSGVRSEASVTGGAVASMRGSWREGRERLETAVALSRNQGDLFSACRGLQHLAAIDLAAGSFAAALSRLEEASELATQMQNRRQTANTVFGIGIVGFLMGDPALVQQTEAALSTMRELGGFWFPLLHAAGLSLWLSPREWEAMPDAVRECIEMSDAQYGVHPARRQRLAAESLLPPAMPSRADPPDPRTEGRGVHVSEAQSRMHKSDRLATRYDAEQPEPPSKANEANPVAATHDAERPESPTNAQDAERPESAANAHDAEPLASLSNAHVVDPFVAPAEVSTAIELLDSITANLAISGTQVWPLEVLKARAHSVAGRREEAGQAIEQALKVAAINELPLRVFEWKRAAVSLATARRAWEVADVCLNEANALSHDMRYTYGEILVLRDRGLAQIERDSQAAANMLPGRRCLSQARLPSRRRLLPTSGGHPLAATANRTVTWDSLAVRPRVPQPQHSDRCPGSSGTLREWGNRWRNGCPKVPPCSASSECSRCHPAHQAALLSPKGIRICPSDRG